MTPFEQHWADARGSPLDVDVLDSLARAAMAEGEEERALELIEPAARQIQTALLWRWVGVLQRSLGRHVEAFASFVEAEQKDWSDVSIAHSLAQVALEAGWDAVRYFERAIGLGPPKSELLLGLAAARFARGEGELAASDMGSILAQSPFWLDGHRQLAQLRSVLGEPERASESLEQAIAQHPSDERLWLTLLNLDLTSSRFADLQRNVTRARAAGVSNSLHSFEAIAASELGEVERADELLGLPDAPQIWKLRHLLRTGRVSEALPLIDAAIADVRSNAIWPYALAAWRAAGDARLEWLIGKDAFVSIVDLSASLPFLDQLTDSLRSLHQVSGQFLDQSVKGGTQTDGPLLSRTQPEFRQLRDVILTAVDDYAAQLPEPDPSHPLLRQRRDRPFRFAGSWSVRLRDGGFHESHVHNSGWISSALYLALPEGQSGDAADKGILELGAPPKALNLDQLPLREIEPAVGRLILFPSWLWHGTKPFQTGERLTIAFDVKLSH